MKRKLYLGILVCMLLGLILLLGGCTIDVADGSKDSKNELNKNSVSSNKATDFKFSDLEDVEFWFGSGAGGWNTVLYIEEDGTFTGYYHDSDMGVNGEGYPKGTRYECTFSGKFKELKKIGDYEYSMKCEDLVLEDEVGEEEIIDGIKIIYSEPYGLNDANEFFLYLPGKNVDELPEEFLSWAHQSWEDGKLICYGLYNVSGEQGFIVWPE